MHDPSPSPSSQPRKNRRTSELSYKFQRLRERLRDAIVSGELTGKLPGERTLAKRFHANAKTLSKALTDLAAEGLLERSIGRGTFVKGEAPLTPAMGKWLILVDPQRPRRYMVESLLKINPVADVLSTPPSTRPSFLNQFTAVIDFTDTTPDTVLRDLMVRNIPVVNVGFQPRLYSTHAVLLDRALGASIIARDLAVGGHRRLLVVETDGHSQLLDAVRATVARYTPDAEVQPATVADVVALVADGATAVVCDGSISANQVRSRLDYAGYAVPDRVSLAAIGPACEPAACTGYFVTVEQAAETVLHLLEEGSARRPGVLWLVGNFLDYQTIAPSQFVRPPAGAGLRPLDSLRV